MKQHMYNVQQSWSPAHSYSPSSNSWPHIMMYWLLFKRFLKSCECQLDPLHHLQMKSIYWDNNFEKSLVKNWKRVKYGSLYKQWWQPHGLDLRWQEEMASFLPCLIKNWPTINLYNFSLSGHFPGTATRIYINGSFHFALLQAWANCYC